MQVGKKMALEVSQARRNRRVLAGVQQGDDLIDEGVGLLNLPLG